MAVAATLGPLVRGVVEGLIGTVILVADEDNPDLAAIADSAGCRVVTAQDWPQGFARAVTIAGGAPVILLDTGIVLADGFWPALVKQMPQLLDRPGATGLDAGFSWRRIGRWLRHWRGKVDQDRAILLPASRARQIAREKRDPWAMNFRADLVEIQSIAYKLPIARPAHS